MTVSSLWRTPFHLLVCNRADASRPPDDLVEELRTYCVNSRTARWAIGFDHRPGSAELARQLAFLLAVRGAAVTLATEACPVSGAILQLVEGRADAALVITALSEPLGCWGAVVIGRNFEATEGPVVSGQTRNPVVGRNRSRRVEERSFREDLIGFYRRLMPTPVLRKAQLQVLVDANGGVANRLLEEVLRGNVARVATIYGLPIGTFYNRPVLPQPGDLFELSLQVERGKWHVGLGLSGGADCLFAVDENGRWVDTGDLQLLLLEAVLRRGSAGSICLGLGVTSRAERLLNQWGVPLKRLASTVCRGAGGMDQFGCEVAIGGWGQLLSRAMPVPDSVYSALWLIRGLAERRMELSRWVDSVRQTFGTATLLWRQLEVSRENVLSLVNREEIHVDGRETLSRVAKNESKRHFVEVKWQSIDSVSWLLLQYSGSYARFLAEAPDSKQAQGLLDEVALLAT